MAHGVLVATALATAGLTPQSARAQTAPAPVAENVAGMEQAAASSPGAGCAAWDVTYALSGVIKITNTPMGGGDGTHPVGPGAMVVRFDDRGGAPSGRARVLSFELQEHFAVNPQAVVFNARVVTDASAHLATDGVAAQGTLMGDTLRWDGPMRGYRTDGLLTCDGSLCGKFGAPPPGRSPLHVGGAVVRFQPLRFARDGASFEMPFALVSETDAPKQRTFLSMSGRQSKRACVTSTTL